jgi:GH15 family glucan-1,4-alpha-glucosidase
LRGGTWNRWISSRTAKPMSEPIENYALLSDMHACALVSATGSVDWLATPRFDSPSCFTALLGTPADGRWTLVPTAPFSSQRRYRGETLVLETTFKTVEGEARVVDCMTLPRQNRELVRVVEGLRGEVTFDSMFAPRFDYASIAPWLSGEAQTVVAVGGPDALVLHAPVALTIAQTEARARFTVHAGEHAAFSITYFPSHLPVPNQFDAEVAVRETEAWWSAWSARCSYRGPYREAVVRSLITLKALTYEPTGAIVAAPTTSLPEALGGVRNWDYRYCWLRDATFTLLALLNAGYNEEATAFTNWLLRAIAGDPAKLQIMYGVAGERRLEEYKLPWLVGYETSQPVRIGNAAFAQFQLDVYGEVIDALWQAIRSGMPPHPAFWTMLRGILDYVARHWERPADNGMWEIRGKPQHFTHSKVMAWVAFDRAVKAVEANEFEGPVEEWRVLRDRIHAEVIELGYDSNRGTFTQYYGSEQLDASLLLLTQVGFLPADDPRIRGTVDAIQRELRDTSFVARYSTEPRRNVDGLPSGEGAFLACSFWLVDNLTLMGRRTEAQMLFEQLLALRNDVGLLSEEYDVGRRRLVGNFPQAFSHLALVNSAYNLSRYEGPAVQRSNPDNAPVTPS